ncbi:MAG: hypothetical protein ACOCP8_01955 [archaeon]
MPVQKIKPLKYYIYFDIKDIRCTYDSDIAKILNININNLHRKFIDDFNGYLHEDVFSTELFFKTKEDAQAALDWAESQLLMKKIKEG